MASGGPNLNMNWGHGNSGAEESFTNADLASVQCVISMELYDGRRYLCLCCMALLQTEVLKRKCHLLMPQQCVLGCG